MVIFIPEKSPNGQALDDKWIRNCITNDAIGRIPNDIQMRDFVATDTGQIQMTGRHESATDRGQSFRDIYKHKIWGASNEHLSGSGISVSGRCNFTRGRKSV